MRALKPRWWKHSAFPSLPSGHSKRTGKPSALQTSYSLHVPGHHESEHWRTGRRIMRVAARPMAGLEPVPSIWAAQKQAMRVRMQVRGSSSSSQAKQALVSDPLTKKAGTRPEEREKEMVHEPRSELDPSCTKGTRSGWFERTGRNCFWRGWCTADGAYSRQWRGIEHEHQRLVQTHLSNNADQWPELPRTTGNYTPASEPSVGLGKLSDLSAFETPDGDWVRALALCLSRKPSLAWSCVEARGVEDELLRE